MYIAPLELKESDRKERDNMDDKIVKVIFKEGWETMYSNDLTQSDYGQVLKIEGLSLPDGNVEVHFSLTEHNGEAPISIGSVKDNVITVNIPDFILQKKDVYTDSYQAYAWIYVTDGESGRTIRKIVFTIDTRAEPTTDVPEDQKDKFLQEVRQVMVETKEIAQSVRDDADNGKFSGIPGEKGDNGKSAYEYAKEGGFEGTEQEFTDLMAQAGQVDLTGYVTKEEHEAELLKAFVKVTTDKAPFHHITDSANMKVVDFGMKGITEQETTPGNQLFDISKVGNYSNDSYGNVDATLTNNGDGSLSVKLITSSSVGDGCTLKDLAPHLIVGETYTLNANVSGTTAKVIYITDGGGTWAFGKSKVITQAMLDGKVRWYADVGGSVATISDIMLNKGDTALPFEKYVGGMPSPNSEHEEEVKLAGVLNEETGRYEIGCYFHAKNLVDENGWKMGYPQISGIGKKLNFPTNNIGRYQIIDVPPNTMVYARLNIKEQTTTLLRAIFCVVDENNIVLAYYNDSSSGNWSSYNINSGNGCKFIISILDTLPENAKIWVNLVELSDFDGYYASQQFTLTSPVPITKWDKLVKRDGVWGWSVWSVLIESYTDESITDEYMSTTGSLTEGAFVQYKTTEEHAFIPLLDEEQELLHNLEMYYGVTNVYNDQGCPMWLTYVADQELHWNQKLLQIQQAII